MHEGPPRSARKQETAKETLEIPPALQRLEEGARATEEMEVLTEAFSDPEKVPRLYDNIPKYYREILGAVVFALAFQAGGVKAAESTERPSAMTESVAAKYEPVLGYNAAAEASKVGRVAVELIGNTGSPRTIVHIAQTHITTPETNLEWKPAIEKSQSEISKFLLATSAPSQQVFVEGFTQVELRQALKEDLSKIAAARDTAAVLSQYKDILKNYGGNERVRALLNNKAGEKLESLGYKETSPLIYSKRGAAIITLKETGLLPPQMKYKVSNAAQSIMAGAAELLDANQRIQMVPAETTEANAIAHALGRALMNKGTELGQIFLTFGPKDPFYRTVGAELLPNISILSADGIKDLAREKSCQQNTECQRLANEILTQDIPATQRAVYIEREIAALKIIALHARTSGQQTFPIVYGASHNFIEAANLWNQQNPEYKFNLIKIEEAPITPPTPGSRP